MAIAIIGAALGACSSDDGGGEAAPTTSEATVGTAGLPASVTDATKGSGRGAKGELGRHIADGRPAGDVAPDAGTPTRQWDASGALHWAAADADGLIVGTGDPAVGTEVAAFDRSGTERWRSARTDLGEGPAFITEDLAVLRTDPSTAPTEVDPEPESRADAGDGDTTPALDGTPNLGIAALELSNGTERWHDETATIDLIDLDLGIVVSRDPERVGGKVIDIESGEVLWSTRAEPLAICGELVLASTVVDQAVAVDARSGEGVELHDRPWQRATCLPDGGYIVHAVDAEGDDIVRIDGDGETRWTRPVPRGVRISQITYTGSVVVIGDPDGLVGLDADDGAELWADEETPVYRPVVVGVDRIFDAAVDGGHPILLDTRTGRNIAPESAVLSSAPFDGGFLALVDGALRCIDAETGEASWSIPVDAYSVDVAGATVVLDDVGATFSAWSSKSG